MVTERQLLSTHAPYRALRNKTEASFGQGHATALILPHEQLVQALSGLLARLSYSQARQTLQFAGIPGCTQTTAATRLVNIACSHTVAAHTCNT